MQKVVSLALAGVNTNDKVRQGDLSMPKGKKCPGIRCKVTVPVKNVQGSGSDAMTDAEKQLMLSLFSLNFSYGKTRSFQPYQNQDWRRIHREARFAYGSELEGYDDSTTGLAKTITAAATANLVFWLVIPTGRMWWLGTEHQDDLAMGRSQAKTVELEVKRGASDVILASNFELNGSVTVDIYPDLVSAKGDRWATLPEYREFDETSLEVATMPDGLPLRVSERTAVHASTSLTNVTVKVDEELMDDQVSPGDMITQYNDVPNVPAAASLVDRETLLYVPLPGAKKDDLPTGRVKVRQNVKDLATIKLGLLYVPIYSEDRLNAEYEHVSTVLRSKPIRAVQKNLIEGREVKARHAIAEPAILFDQDDREFEMYPGPVAEPNKPAALTIPKGVLERTKAVFGMHTAAGEMKAASHAIKTLAGNIPGAVGSGRGFRSGFSSILGRVNAFFR